MKFKFSVLVFAFFLEGSRWAVSAQDDYDRLDGMGASGVEVNVIEWADNHIEQHVKPKGALLSLGLKVDRKKSKAVLVSEYVFKSRPHEKVIRRAILGVPLGDSLKAYVDTQSAEMDRILITDKDPKNMASSKSVKWENYALGPEPSALYPVEVAKAPQPAPDLPQTTGSVPSERARVPASNGKQDEGAIQNYSW